MRCSHDDRLSRSHLATTSLPAPGDMRRAIFRNTCTGGFDDRRTLHVPFDDTSEASRTCTRTRCKSRAFILTERRRLQPQHSQKQNLRKTKSESEKSEETVWCMLDSRHCTQPQTYMTDTQHSTHRRAPFLVFVRCVECCSFVRWQG